MSLSFRFCRSSMEREGSKFGLLDWTGFSVCFCFLIFLAGSVLSVLGTGLASSLEELEDRFMRLRRLPCICDAWLGYAF
jgi:hypothetical protein